MKTTILMILNFRLPLIALLFLAGSLFPSQGWSKTKSNVQLKQAIESRKAGEHWKAVDILFKLRDKHATHKRINLELVLNFIKLREYERAESVLLYIESLQLNELEQQKLEKLKQILVRKMRKPLSAHRWVFDVGASLGHDVVNSHFPVLIVEDYQFEDGSWLSDDLDDQLWEDAEFGDFEYTDGYDIVSRENETSRKESSYLSEFVNANYRYRPLDSLSWFEQPTFFIWDSDLSTEFRQIDDDKKSKYNRISADTSIYLLRVNHWLVEAGAKVSIHYNDGRRLLTDTRERIAITLPFHQHKFKFAVDFAQKHYQSALSYSNAKTTMPWFEYSYSLSDKLRASVGLRHKQLRANDAFLSYNNNTVFAALYYYPFTQLSAYISLNNYALTYKIDDPELVNWSKEDKTSFGAGVKYHFNDNVSLSLNGHYSKNTIELGFGEDDWRRIEASLTYRF
ncbi:porin family protein [Thalassotalea sp. M1531]|uniref:Porin family protein n=1 Tax=Thalassotalea algicola TaxID=2716224 RepID=A0A7Y0LFJ9_9GAMM|nr:outer membrane beta-barrel protein [Thalassotalea algicola]NMP33564.1 porin family protein [Thalassotalea algicola]